MIHDFFGGLNRNINWSAGVGTTERPVAQDVEGVNAIFLRSPHRVFFIASLTRSLKFGLTEIADAVVWRHSARVGIDIVEKGVAGIAQHWAGRARHGYEVARDGRCPSYRG